MPTTRHVDKRPNSLRLFGRAALSSVLPGGGGAELPDTELLLADVSIDRAHLASYDQVCGFPLSDRLPATYPHILAFPLALDLMTSRDFPFPVAGMVHVANTITQTRVITADETLSLHVRTEHLRPHARGQQFDVVHEARTDGAAIWSSVSTYLKRGPGADESAREDRLPEPEAEPSAIWAVPGDTGRRYAAVSGDVNPIHLTSLTARAMGFKRAIAHGMWTAARTLAAVVNRLPDAFVWEVQFQQPVFLPGRIALLESTVGDELRLQLRSADGNRSHLTSVVRPA